MSFKANFNASASTFRATFGGTQKPQAPDDRIGSLSDLLTSDKSSIVAAINELARRLTKLEGGAVASNTTATLGKATIGLLKLGS